MKTKLHLLKINASRVLKLSLVLFIPFMLLSCSNDVASSPDYQIAEIIQLPNVLHETSGLYCNESHIFSVNDSGNAATLFVLSSSGQLANQAELAVKNRDWEAITADDEFIYIADVGNNSGWRRKLQVHLLDRHTYGWTQTLTIAFADKPRNISTRNHDRDFEALVANDEYLYLVSKSWQSQVAHVYRLAKNSDDTVATPFLDIPDLPGIVTGIDFDAANQRYIVVGYKVAMLGVLTPFIAELSNNFELRRVVPLRGMNQVEGVCVQGDKLWISQESSPFEQAKLVQLVGF